MTNMSSAYYSPGAVDFHLLEMFSDDVGGMLNVSFIDEEDDFIDEPPKVTSIDEDIAILDEIIFNEYPQLMEVKNENLQPQPNVSAPSPCVQEEKRKKRKRVEYDGPFKKPLSRQKFNCRYCSAVFKDKLESHNHQVHHIKMAMNCVRCNWYGTSLSHARRHYAYLHCSAHRNYIRSEFRRY